MRVSSYQLLDAGIRSIQEQSVDAMKWQRQIASGDRYAKASEGSVAVTRGVEIRFDQSRFEMLKANQDFVAERMAKADTQLKGMHDIFQEMKQISVQARATSVTQSGLQSLAVKARAAYEDLKQKAVAMDADDERYLLRDTSTAGLDQPKTRIGGSEAVAQVDTITLAGSVWAGDVVQLNLNGVPVTYAVQPADIGGSDAATRANVMSQLFAALNNSGNPAHTSVVPTLTGDIITLTADQPGIPFAASSAMLVSGGGATLSRAESVANISAISSAEISSKAIFVQEGRYTIDGFSTRSLGGNPPQYITEARLRIDGKGPDGTGNTYFTGVYEDGILRFPQEPGTFFNLELAIEGNPDSLTTIEFNAKPATVELNSKARLHASGNYEVVLNKGDQFGNVGFKDTAVRFDGTAIKIDGWTASTQGVAGLHDVSFSDDTMFGSGKSLRMQSTGLAAGGSTPVLASNDAVKLYDADPVTGRTADQISFRWRAAPTGAATSASVTFNLRNVDTGVLLSPAPFTRAITGSTNWEAVNVSIPSDGRYKLEISATNTSAVSGGVDLYLDDIQTVSSSKDFVSATLKLDGNPLKTVSVGDGGVVYNSATKTTAVNFGSSSEVPAKFYDLSMSVVGNPMNMTTGDTIRFRADADLKQMEIEPGVFVPEGISFRQVLGTTGATSRDVLADALAFVQDLEAAGQNGSLPAGFTGKISNMEKAADQVLQAQVRAGVIGARVDAAIDALETKSTELENYRSRLLDTDIAEASAGLVRSQTLLEAARSVFARLEASNLFQRLG
jgi:flagellin-like hook-associated protein FlgL